MALKSKENKIEKAPIQEQITFADLEYDLAYEDENAQPIRYTISGKESDYEPEWDLIKMNELDVGDEFEGKPEVMHFVNENRKSDSLRIRVMDDGEILDCYVNIPKPDPNGVVTNIRAGFDYYRTCYDFAFSILKLHDETSVIDENGEVLNKFNRINIMSFAKLVDGMDRIGVRITEGNASSDYNSFIIYKME